MKTSLLKASKAIQQANKIAIACHVNPDGDTLGSALALCHAFRAMGKQAVPLVAHGVPEIYRWMPGQEWVRTETADQDFDLAIMCDTSSLDRIGSIASTIEHTPVTMTIDHHACEGTFGQYRVVNSKAAATGELVYALLRELGATFSKELAECLLCAIITDTGSYRFMNVTPNTFRISGALMRCGARPAAISELVFESRSYASIKLLGRALDSLKVSDDSKIAWAHVTAAEFAELNARDEETEGIVNHVRAVRGVQVGVLFREVPGKKIRISLRARDGADVNLIAQKFGGGGHRLAAGCSIELPLADAEIAVIEAVRQSLDGYDKTH